MATAETPQSTLLRLPDELLEAIVTYLPPTETVNFGLACKRCNRSTYEPLVWRRHCIQTWKYWDAHHELPERLELPPAQTRWQRLFNERQRVDREVLALFDRALLTQQHRIERMEEMASHGYDVKDLMQSVREETPDDAPDALARRWHATAVLGKVHRATALEKWARLQKRQMVKLEDVLGAFDLFVLSGDRGDLDDIGRELDRLAQCIRARDPDFDALPIRRKAVRVARYLRSEGLVGNPHEGDYHALRNNFISLALFDAPHTSLPLQSVAIYCSVARKLGIDAKPSNYPSHVHAVITAPADQTLDGKHRLPLQGAEPERMYLDPWRNSDEVPLDQLRLRLRQLGSPEAHHAAHLAPTSTLEVALRTSRNIMTSVQEARERHRGAPPALRVPDVEAAWYSMVWSMMVLGDAGNAAANLHRRRQCLPYLIEHFQAHFPEDLGLVERLVLPMFDCEREFRLLVEHVAAQRERDRNPRPVAARTGGGGEARAASVMFRVGQHFRHRRYSYTGFIIGWDPRCSAEPGWIVSMRVDELPGGREQPFYNVIADDKSGRYVAQENIVILEEKPGPTLWQLAGRYFKRWDDETHAFVSNIKDEYPDD